MLGHASASAALGAYRVKSLLSHAVHHPSFQTGRQAKIALKASSEDDLLELEAMAKSLNLCARAIHDAYVRTSHSRMPLFTCSLSAGELR